MSNMSDLGKVLAADKNAKAAIVVTKALRDEVIPALEDKIKKLEEKCAMQDNQIKELVHSVSMLKAKIFYK